MRVANYWHVCISIRPAYRQGAREPFGVQWTDLERRLQRTRMCCAIVMQMGYNGAKKLSPVMVGCCLVFCAATRCFRPCAKPRFTASGIGDDWAASSMLLGQLVLPGSMRWLR